MQLFLFEIKNVQREIIVKQTIQIKEKFIIVNALEYGEIRIHERFGTGAFIDLLKS